MSFKSRLIEYCEGIKIDCCHCPFREPCDKVTPDSIPSRWGDNKFDEMQENTWLYAKSISNKMSEISRVMLDASQDDVAEINKWLST